MVAGLHVPAKPLLDIVGSAGGTEPSHIGAIAVKVGATTGTPVRLKVCGSWQRKGVKT